MIADLLCSSEIFMIFEQILAVLRSGRSQYFLRFPLARGSPALFHGFRQQSISVSLCNIVSLILAYIVAWVCNPVGWLCRIRQLYLCRGLRPPPQWVSWYDTKQTDGEGPVMLELWGMRSTPSLPSLPGPLWPGVVAPDRVLSMGQIELSCILMLNWIVRNRTVFTLKLRVGCVG